VTGLYDMLCVFDDEWNLKFLNNRIHPLIYFNVGYQFGLYFFRRFFTGRNDPQVLDGWAFIVTVVFRSLCVRYVSLDQCCEKEAKLTY